MNYITVEFLVVILYISEARCYHWRKLSEDYRRSLYYFSKLHVVLKLSQKKRQIVGCNIMFKKKRKEMKSVVGACIVQSSVIVPESHVLPTMAGPTL